MALHLVRSQDYRGGRVQDGLRCDEQLGREPWRNQLRAYRRGFDYHVFHAAHPCLHAQRGRGQDFPSGGMERFRHGQGGPGLPRLRGLRAYV